MAAPLLDNPGRTRAAGKYLTFQLGGGVYGVPILRVREIIRLVDITPIPRMPAYVRGVINLRGKIVPVIDLGTKLGLPASASGSRPCIVVCYVRVAQLTKLMGVTVDAAEEVDQINAEDMEPAPDFGKGAPAGHIQNLAKAKGRLKTLLNIDSLVQEDHALLPAEALPDTAR